MASTRLRLEEASEELAAAVRALIAAKGLRNAAIELGMGSAAATNVAARIPVQRGTLALAKVWHSGAGGAVSPAGPWPVVATLEPKPIDLRPYVPATIAVAPQAQPRIVAASGTPKPPPAALTQAMTNAIRAVGGLPAIPWRIVLGAQLNGEYPLQLDFAGCARAWGCNEPEAEAMSRPIAHVNDDILTDPSTWLFEPAAAPLARVARYAAREIVSTHQAMTGGDTRPPEEPAVIAEMDQREQHAAERRALAEQAAAKIAQLAAGQTEPNGANPA